MGITQIRTALVKAVIAELKKPPFSFTDGQIIFENTPAPDTPLEWAQLIFAARQPTVATMGGGGTDQVRGILRVDVRHPLDTVIGTGLALVDAMRTALPAGTRLSFEGQEVAILNIGADTGSVVDTWYRTNISVAFRAFLPRGG